MDILKGLNEKQIEAVTTVSGPVLIIAGPGSGKTKALTHRVAYLIYKRIRPENILAVTFTNKAAGEMRSRVALLLANAVGLPTICTFHSLCARILRKEGQKLGYAKNFIIYDEEDQLSLMKKVIKDLEIDTSQFDPRRILNLISSQKNELIDEGLYKETADDFFTKIISRVYDSYQANLKKSNALDFDDLLMKAVELFRKNPEILKRYQALFQYVLVDEWQDTNVAQYVLTKLLAQNHKNLFVIGDIDQSIYRWRQADYRNILNFERDFPGANVILLEENYRSTQNILEAANKIISKNVQRKDKNLWTRNKRGASLIVKEVSSEKEEGYFITNEIGGLLAEKGLKLKDFTILYRTNAQSRAIEEAFLETGFPYKIIGSVRFYERREIKDIVAWLKLCVNEKDEISRKRILKLRVDALTNPKSQAPNSKQITSTKFQTKKTKSILVNDLLEDFGEKAEGYSLTNLIKYIIKTTGYENYIRDGSEAGESRWENLQELLTVAKKFEKEAPHEVLDSFLEETALLSEQDEVEDKKDLVNLMTVHAAKGLEFNTVFIAGCEEGLFPHSRSMLDPEALEEERRLCYVALTRAQKNAYFIFARSRNIFGSTQANPPSRFLLDIPENLIEFRTAEEEGMERTIELG